MSAHSAQAHRSDACPILRPARSSIGGGSVLSASTVPAQFEPPSSLSWGQPASSTTSTSIDIAAGSWSSTPLGRAIASWSCEPSSPSKWLPTSPPKIEPTAGIHATPRQQLGWAFLEQRQPSPPPRVDDSDDAESTELSFVTCDTVSATPPPAEPEIAPRSLPPPTTSLPPAALVAIALAIAECELAAAALDPIAQPAEHARAFARIIGELVTVGSAWAAALQSVRFRCVGASTGDELRAVIEAIVGNATRAESVRTLALERLSEASVHSISALVMCCAKVVDVTLSFAPSVRTGEQVLIGLGLYHAIASCASLRRLTLGSLPPVPIAALAKVVAVSPALHALRLEDTTLIGGGADVLRVERLELQSVEGDVLDAIEAVTHLELAGPRIAVTPAQLLARLRQSETAASLRSIRVVGVNEESRWRGSAAEMRLLRTVLGRRGVHLVVL